jgi:hypothetical protein
MDFLRNVVQPTTEGDDRCKVSDLEWYLSFPSEHLGFYTEQELPGNQLPEFFSQDLPED